MFFFGAAAVILGVRVFFEGLRKVSTDTLISSALNLEALGGDWFFLVTAVTGLLGLLNLGVVNFDVDFFFCTPILLATKFGVVCSLIFFA